MTDRQPDAALSEWDNFEAWWAKNGAEEESKFPGDFPFIAFKMCSWSAWNARAKALRSEPSAPSRDAVLEEAVKWHLDLADKWQSENTVMAQWHRNAAIGLRALKEPAPQAEVRTVRPEEAARSPAAAAPAPKGNAELVSRAADTLRAQDQQEVGGIQVLTIDFWRARAVYLAEGVLREAADALERTEESGG